MIKLVHRVRQHRRPFRWQCVSERPIRTETDGNLDLTHGYILIGETAVDDAEPEVTRSHFGLAVSSCGIDGKETYGYDALGRKTSVSSFATGSDVLRARQFFTYDVSGNVIGTVSDYGADGRAVGASSFDVLGREVSATDALGNTVTTDYDALGRVVSTSGDAYPLRTGYDSTGRKIRGATTRDGGAT